MDKHYGAGNERQRPMQPSPHQEFRNIDEPAGERHTNQETRDRKQAHQETIPSGLEGDIIREINNTEPGTILSLRGLTAKHENPNNMRETRQDAKQYLPTVKDFYAKSNNHNVIVISSQELLEKGIGESGAYGEALIKNFAHLPENKDKTIVVDYLPHFEETVFAPWKHMSDTLMHEVLTKRGSKGDAWLTDWLQRQEKGEASKEGEPHLKDVLEAFNHGYESLTHFKHSHLGERGLSIGLDASNPLELAFLVFCATGKLSTEALRSTLVGDNRPDKRVGFVRINSTSISTSLGSRNQERMRPS